MPLLVRFRALNLRNPLRVNLPVTNREVDAYMSDFMQALIDSIKEYPPEPANSTYVRRGMHGGLLGSWRVNSSNTGIAITKGIVNTAVDPRGRRYAIYVQGQLQTMMHAATGWQRIDLAAEALRRRYRSDLQAIYTKNIIRGP